MIKPTIKIYYSCHLCSAQNVILSVPARMSPQEDLRTWMDETVLLIARNHSDRSPACKAETIGSISIPTGDAEWIGGLPKRKAQ